MTEIQKTKQPYRRGRGSLTSGPFRRWTVGVGMTLIVLFGSPGIAQAVVTGCYAPAKLEFSVNSVGSWRHYRGSDVTLGIPANSNTENRHNDMWVQFQWREVDRGIHHFPEVHKSGWARCDMETGCVLGLDIGKSNQEVRFIYESERISRQVNYSGEVTMCSSW